VPVANGEMVWLGWGPSDMDRGRVPLDDENIVGKEGL
jgi:hypothetical protein